MTTRNNILITGASSGLGRGMAIEFAKLGRTQKIKLFAKKQKHEETEDTQKWVQAKGHPPEKIWSIRKSGGSRAAPLAHPGLNKKQQFEQQQQQQQQQLQQLWLDVDVCCEKCAFLLCFCL